MFKFRYVSLPYPGTRAGAALPAPPDGPAGFFVEPWHLSSCRAVEAPSRRCRGAVEALSRCCRGLACRACRVTVEFLSSLLSLTPCAWASSSVEVCRGLSRSVEVCRGLSSCRAVELSSNVELLNSCLAVEPGNAYAYSFA